MLPSLETIFVTLLGRQRLFLLFLVPLLELTEVGDYLF